MTDLTTEIIGGGDETTEIYIDGKKASDEVTVSVFGSAGEPTEIYINGSKVDEVTIGVIGGADGPTQIYITGSEAPVMPIWLYFLIAAGIVTAMTILAMLGFHAYEKRKEK